MRTEAIIFALETKKRELEAGVFKSPPEDQLAFKMLLGRWIGISESINTIAELLKKEKEYDDD